MQSDLKKIEGKIEQLHQKRKIVHSIVKFICIYIYTYLYIYIDIFILNLPVKMACGSTSSTFHLGYPSFTPLALPFWKPLVVHPTRFNGCDVFPKPQLQLSCLGTFNDKPRREDVGEYSAVKSGREHVYMYVYIYR